MTYIPLQSLKMFLGLPDVEIFFTDKDTVDRAVEQAYEAGRTFTSGKSSFTQLELSQMLSQLKDQVVIVFDQWICASPNMLNLLTEGEAGKNDFNPQLQGHFLFADFKRFVTPFLVPELKTLLDQNTEKNKLYVASYIPVLSEEGQFIIQEKLVRDLESNWKKLLKNLEKTSSSADFNEKVKYFFLPPQVELINYFTKPFYSHKVRFIENAIELFKHPLSTAPFVLWMTKQLKNLELNPEHKEKVQDVHRSLLEGNQQYFTAQSSRISTWTLPKVLGMLAVLALVGFSVFYLVNFTGINAEEKEKTASSFSKFTKDERMQLDSLIRTMEHQTAANEDFTDQQNTTYLHLTPVEVEVDTRDPLRNKLAEQYVQDCIRAYDLNNMNLIDSCAIYPENKIKKLDNNPFTAASRLKGEKPLVLKNESDYQVQVLIFEEKSDGEVYTAFVQSNETFKCNINAGYKVILIPGNNLGQAELPKLSRISKFYRHHFCFMDGNYLSQMFQVYTVKPITQAEIKILLNSTPNQQLYVVDLYEAFKMEN